MQTINSKVPEMTRRTKRNPDFLDRISCISVGAEERSRSNCLSPLACALPLWERSWKIMLKLLSLRLKSGRQVVRIEDKCTTHQVALLCLWFLDDRLLISAIILHLACSSFLVFSTISNLARSRCWHKFCICSRFFGKKTQARQARWVRHPVTGAVKQSSLLESRYLKNSLDC